MRRWPSTFSPAVLPAPSRGRWCRRWSASRSSSRCARAACPRGCRAAARRPGAVGAPSFLVLRAAAAQVQGPGPATHHGVWGTLKQIWLKEGIVGYFKGNGTNIIRIAPYSAVQFAAYEKYKAVRPSARARGGGAQCDRGADAWAASFSLGPTLPPPAVAHLAHGQAQAGHGADAHCRRSGRDNVGDVHVPAGPRTDTALRADRPYVPCARGVGGALQEARTRSRGAGAPHWRG